MAAAPGIHTSGMVWGFHFVDGVGRLLAETALPERLKPAQGFIWAHFPLSDQRARTYLERFADLPDDARELLLGPDAQPRLTTQDGWTFGVLPDFERDFEGQSLGFGRMRFAFDGTRFLTTRRHALQCADAIRRKIDGTRLKPLSTLDLFVALARQYSELVEDEMLTMAQRLDDVEDEVLAAPLRKLERLELAPLRRDFSRLHREIAALRTAYHRGAAREFADRDDAIVAHLKALAQRSEDVDREILALQDRARLIHEEVDTRINSATNKTLRALTIMTALMIAPTVLVGAFGMNVQGVPFASDGFGFYLALGVCALAVALVWATLARLRVI